MARKSILGEFVNNDIKKLSFNNQIENIHYKKIRPAKKNRELRRIEELALDIAEDGLENCITIRKIEDPEFEYELVAGERRYTAICHNIENGDLTYEYIPSKIEVLNDLDARRRLILNNYQNDPLTPAEKMDAVEELKEIYRLKKEAGEKIPGRLQEVIANELGMKKSQIGTYEKVINNAVPEVRDLVKDGEMTISAAAELSSLEDEEQLMFVENNVDFDIKTIKEYKDELLSEESREEIETVYDEESDFESEENTDYIEEDVIEITEKADEEIEEISQEHTTTITDCVNEIASLYDNLSEKIKGVEWKEECPYLIDAIESFNNLKTVLRIK